MRKPILLTRGGVFALGVAWFAVAVAIVWLAFVSSDLAHEKTVRARQDHAAVAAIESLLADLVANTKRVHLPGFKQRAAEYQRLLDQLRAGGDL